MANKDRIVGLHEGAIIVSDEKFRICLDERKPGEVVGSTIILLGVYMMLQDEDFLGEMYRAGMEHLQTGDWQN